MRVAKPVPPTGRGSGEPPGRDGIQAHAPRIAEAIRDVGKIGVDPAGGWTRLAFSDEERAAHEVVARWLDQLGLKVDQDAIGNTWVRREGTNPDGVPIVVGSHLDTVPQGGRFDGVAGVVAMVETMRILEEHSVETSHPVVGIIFSAEEGARFGEPCIGSKAVAGTIDESHLTRLRDAAGATAADAMVSVGLDPERVTNVRWGRDDAAAFLELHIEQGRLLEANKAAIGLVDVVSGSTRMRVTVTGEAGHSGASPMRNRADAMAAAAQMILAVESLAKDPFHRGLRGTVGWIDVHPNSATTIPGRVSMMVDVRDVDSDRQREATGEILRKLRGISELRGVEMDAEVVADTSPAVLSMWLRELLREVCVGLSMDFRVLSSGAGHDAQIMAHLLPSALVFVPSAGGVSHHPDEWTSPEAIAKGVDVLVGSLIRLDDVLSSTVG
jgi:allantoate deiminase